MSPQVPWSVPSRLTIPSPSLTHTLSESPPQMQNNLSNTLTLRPTLPNIAIARTWANRALETVSSAAEHNAPLFTAAVDPATGEEWSEEQKRTRTMCEQVRAVALFNNGVLAEVCTYFPTLPPVPSVMASDFSLQKDGERIPRSRTFPQRGFSRSSRHRFHCRGPRGRPGAPAGPAGHFLGGGCEQGEEEWRVSLEKVLVTGRHTYSYIPIG